MFWTTPYCVPYEACEYWGAGAGWRVAQPLATAANNAMPANAIEDFIGVSWMPGQRALAA